LGWSLIGLLVLRPPILPNRMSQSAAEPRGPHFKCGVFESSLTPPVSSSLIDIWVIVSNSSPLARDWEDFRLATASRVITAGFRLPLGGQSAHS
jgi:hypothetical protein